MKEFLSKLRKDYSLMGLYEKDMEKDPIKQFEKWIIDAANANIPEPNAMTLCTVGKNMKPQSRIVLLRNFDHRGFVFYTNYHSDKAKDIEENPYVCINFFWVDLERQVRIEGVAGKISQAESNEYFQLRPRLNQISAWASPQSQVIASREELEQKVKELEQKFKDLPVIEKPPFWGGYRVVPTSIEFWQGRPNRLHDRIRYQLQKDKNWKMERLAP
jgi:pyridoxamine 5'-phosphate oxidase